MNKKILSYDDVKNIQFGSSDEPLVKANTYDDRIVCEYKKYDMFAWTGFDILVRDSVARKLADANDEIQKYGFNLKVVYGYRSIDVQQRYFDRQYNKLRCQNPTMSDEELLRLTHNYVARPNTAGHTLGAAVDVTLVSGDKECDMGTEIADYNDPNAIQTFARVSKERAKSRKILLNAMMNAGFAPFLGEWWHFSYGDKEWAAYFDLKQAIYAPVTAPQKMQLYLIAGGNKTALQITEKWRGGMLNQLACDSLMKTFSDIDQAGIYYEDTNKLEMAGGEFCGNATTAAAVVQAANSFRQKFQVSGLDSIATTRVTEVAVNRWIVAVKYSTMTYRRYRKTLLDATVDIVDFGGITHILVKGSLPKDYLLEAQKIRTEADLMNSDAVGVIWYKRQGDRLSIDPVVWVRKIDTHFYESSCGSGAVAAAIVSGVSEIAQPTGESICVNISDDGIQTITEVERL